MDGIGALESNDPAAYCSTVSLLGQVIALHGTRIARERARPRPDFAVIAALESTRTAAVATCRTLHRADAGELESVRDSYARLYLELISGAGVALLRSGA